VRRHLHLHLRLPVGSVIGAHHHYGLASVFEPPDFEARAELADLRAPGPTLGPDPKQTRSPGDASQKR